MKLLLFILPTRTPILDTTETEPVSDLRPFGLQNTLTWKGGSVQEIDQTKFCASVYPLPTRECHQRLNDGRKVTSTKTIHEPLTKMITSSTFWLETKQGVIIRRCKSLSTDNSCNSHPLSPIFGPH